MAQLAVSLVHLSTPDGRSLEEAIRHLHIAADAALPDAHLAVSDAHRLACGVAVDPAPAAGLHEQAAAPGVLRSRDMLDAEAGPPDVLGACKWLLAARPAQPEGALRRWVDETPRPLEAMSSRDPQAQAKCAAREWLQHAPTPPDPSSAD